MIKAKLKAKQEVTFLRYISILFEFDDEQYQGEMVSLERRLDILHDKLGIDRCTLQE